MEKIELLKELMKKYVEMSSVDVNAADKILNLAHMIASDNPTAPVSALVSEIQNENSIEIAEKVAERVSEFGLESEKISKKRKTRLASDEVRKLYEQVKKIMGENNLLNLNDVLAQVGLSSATYYRYAIKDANRIENPTGKLKIKEKYENVKRELLADENLILGDVLKKYGLNRITYTLHRKKDNDRILDLRTRKRTYSRGDKEYIDPRLERSLAKCEKVNADLANGFDLDTALAKHKLSKLTYLRHGSQDPEKLDISGRAGRKKSTPEITDIVENIAVSKSQKIKNATGNTRTLTVNTLRHRADRVAAEVTNGADLTTSLAENKISLDDYEQYRTRQDEVEKITLETENAILDDMREHKIPRDKVVKKYGISDAQFERWILPILRRSNINDIAKNYKNKFKDAIGSKIFSDDEVRESIKVEIAKSKLKNLTVAEFNEIMRIVQH